MSRYWNHHGRFQEQYDSLMTQLVPRIGPAESLAGELLRCVSNLGYERFNNGNGNRDVKSLQNQGRFLLQHRGVLTAHAVFLGLNVAVFAKALTAVARMYGNSRTHHDAVDMVTDVVVSYAHENC